MIGRSTTSIVGATPLLAPPWPLDGVDPSVVGATAAAVGVAMVVAHLLDRWCRPPRRPAAIAVGHTDASALSAEDTSVEPGRTGALPSGRRGLPALRRRRPTPPETVATWLDDVARSTRVGSGLRDAILETSPDSVGESVEPLRRRLRNGDSIGDAVDGWRARLDPNDESLLTAATTLVVTEQVGGSIAVPLERSAALLRSRAAVDRERDAWAAQSRLSAQVLAVLPVAVFGVLVLLDPDVRALATEPLGLALVFAGAVLDAIGFAWMRRVVNRASR